MGSPKETVENFHATYWQILVLNSTSVVWNARHLVTGKIPVRTDCLCERHSRHLVVNEHTCKWGKSARLTLAPRAGRFDDTILLCHPLLDSDQYSCSPARAIVPRGTPEQQCAGRGRFNSHREEMVPSPFSRATPAFQMKRRYFWLWF